MDLTPKIQKVLDTLPEDIQDLLQGIREQNTDMYEETVHAILRMHVIKESGNIEAFKSVVHEQENQIAELLEHMSGTG